MLTKRQAFRECKEMWDEIEKSGKSKYKFLDTKKGEVWRMKSYWNTCPLCEYAFHGNYDCHTCPLSTQYKNEINFEIIDDKLPCYQLGFQPARKPSQKWLNAIKGLKE